MSYEADVRRASRLMPLVKESFAASLTEAATRFAISHPAVGTILVGMATPQQFEAALAASRKGPLPCGARRRCAVGIGRAPSDCTAPAATPNRRYLFGAARASVRNSSTAAASSAAWPRRSGSR